MKPPVIFRIDGNNKYSFLALEASLEEQGKKDWLTIIKPYKASHDQLINNISELLNYHKRVFIAYSFTTVQWGSVKEEWKSIKRIFDGDRVIIIAGGPHPSGSVKRVLQEGARAVFVGDGEGSFPGGLLHLSFPEKYDSPGGFYTLQQDGKLNGRKNKPFKEWTWSFPFPRINPSFGPIEITRGCPFKCSYCQTSSLKGSLVRHKKERIILEAVEFLTKRGKKDIRFITPNALSYGSSDGRTPNTYRLSNLLDGIRKIISSKGRIFFGSFPSEVRPEFINEETVSILRTYCNNKSVVVGAQSGSDRMLRLMRRGHTSEDIIAASEKLLSYGFTPIVDFIFGLPYEEEEDVLKTITLIEKLSSLGARLHAHHFMPLAGSRWAFLKPNPVSLRVRRLLQHLIARGKLFGQWMHQEKAATTDSERAKNITCHKKINVV